MKLRLITATLLFLLFSQTHAQAILKAYIVKPNGDSVNGYLKLEGTRFSKNIREYLATGVAFSETQDNFKKYKPTDLKEFGYCEAGSNDYKKYASEKVYKKDLFLLIYIEGPLRLYKNMYLDMSSGHITTGFHFYYGKKGQPVLDVEDKHFDKVKKRGPLREYLSDCPLMENELNQKDFDFWAVIEKYNAWYKATHND